MKNTITRIEAQKRNKDRVNIYIDEEFGFACSAELVYTYDLRKGKEIDLDYINGLAEEDNYLKGKSYALKLVEKSYKTENEIVEKLLKREYSEKSIERILIFLKEYKFIDDEKYADMFFKDKIKSCGRNKIKYNLRKKGIDEKLIEKKMNSMSYEEEYEGALKLAQKKLVFLTKSEKSTNKIYKKMVDLLIRNGYDFDLINEILNKVMEKKIVCVEQTEEESYMQEEDKYEEIKELALKRYNIIIKSQNDPVKIVRRLTDYLMRRGYKYEDINKIVKTVVNN